MQRKYEPNCNSSINTRELVWMDCYSGEKNHNVLTMIHVHSSSFQILFKEMATTQTTLLSKEKSVHQSDGLAYGWKFETIRHLRINCLPLKKIRVSFVGHRDYKVAWKLFRFRSKNLSHVVPDQSPMCVFGIWLCERSVPGVANGSTGEGPAAR